VVDGIDGLKELLGKYPDLLPLHLSSVLSRCADLLLDPETNVRRQLLGLFSFMLPLISPVRAAPVYRTDRMR